MARIPRGIATLRRQDDDMAMDPRIEASALAEVRLRLAERFPTLGDELVEAAVRIAHSELTGPIRDFVPVLVEHIARERLGSMVDDSPMTAHRSKANMV